MKVIIFDAGGVYFKGKFTEFVKNAYEYLNLNRDVLSESVHHFDPDLNRGQISIEYCFKEFFNLPLTNEQIEHLKKLWLSNWIVNMDVLDMIKVLSDDYKLVLLSNSDKLNSDAYKRKGWYGYFDLLMLSHELGVMKPNSKIYKLVLERLKVSASDCVFIDDQAESLHPAEELGMHVILYKYPEQLRQQLNNLNVKV